MAETEKRKVTITDTANMNKLINRLENFKFGDAHDIARNMNLTYLQHETIRFLAKLYGDTGWIYGDVGQFIHFVMNLLCHSLKDNELEVNNG